MLRSPATSFLRTAATRRTLTSTAACRTSHPAHSTSDQGGIGEDVREVQTKNSLIPVFMAIGAASVGYITYAQMSAGKADRKAEKEAPKSGQDEKVVLGEKPKMSSRG